mmetsp:Transcript_2399/g.7292  ORF Transcript_2399/g.7292 Transcript_2399/m.7292 type:complete len:274 (+) Transcript_2399:1901-2722(+)
MSARAPVASVAMAVSAAQFATVSDSSRDVVALMSLMLRVFNSSLASRNVVSVARSSAHLSSMALRYSSAVTSFCCASSRRAPTTACSWSISSTAILTCWVRVCASRDKACSVPAWASTSWSRIWRLASRTTKHESRSARYPSRSCRTLTSSARSEFFCSCSPSRSAVMAARALLSSSLRARSLSTVSCRSTTAVCSVSSLACVASFSAVKISSAAALSASTASIARVISSSLVVSAASWASLVRSSVAFISSTVAAWSDSISRTRSAWCDCRL